MTIGADDSAPDENVALPTVERPTVEIFEPAEGAIRFDTTLSVTEITGSETFVHLDHHGERWVGLVHGIRDLQPGQALDVYLDPSRVYLFDKGGALVAGAPYAEAA